MKPFMKKRWRAITIPILTATDKPNVFDVNLSATGRDYVKNKEHALFVLDRTGSVGQSGQFIMSQVTPNSAQTKRMPQYHGIVVIASTPASSMPSPARISSTR